MKNFRKALSLLLVLSMLLGLCAGITVSAAETTTTPTVVNGKCGNSVTYSLHTGTGQLTVSGSGAMYDYSTENRPPWYDQYNGIITRVTVSGGITKIGNYAFNNLVQCKEYVINAPVTTIGEFSFSHGSFQNINLPNSVTTIQLFAFNNCGAIRTSSFPLTAAIAFGNKDLTDANPNYVASQDYAIADGTQGDISWTLSKSGTLMITPRLARPGGAAVAMPDFTLTNNVSTAPWAAFSKHIVNIDISSQINSVGDYAFAYLNNVKTVSLGTEIADIGKYAFYFCTGLTGIDLRAATKTIDEYAFAGTTLTSATTPLKAGELTIAKGNDPLTRILQYSSSGGSGSSATSGSCGTNVQWAYNASQKLLEIAGSGYMEDYTVSSPAPWVAYRGEIEEVRVYDGVKSIGSYAFYGMSKLKKVSVGSAVMAIGASAFQDCTALSSVALPQSTVLIESNAFYACSGLTYASYAGSQAAISISSGNEPLTRVLRYNTAGGGSGSGSIPSTPTTQDAGQIPSSNIFWSYMETTRQLTLYSTAATGEYMPDFYLPQFVPWEHLASKITKVQILSGIKNIGTYAFANMPLLDTVEFGDVTRIGENAFLNASNLRKMKFPKSLVTVDANAFSGCLLTEVTTDNYQYQMSIAALGNYSLLSVIKYAGGSSGSTDTGNIISGSCGSALTYTFNLTSGLLTISGWGPMTEYALYNQYPWATNADKITRVEIAEGVSSIGGRAFYMAANMTSISMGSTMRNIGDYAFNACSKLTYAYVATPAANVQISDKGNYNLTRVLTYGSGSGSSINPGTSVSGATIPGSPNLTWSYDAQTQSLSIRGNGAIPDYTTPYETPWVAYAGVVKGISIYSGVTAIGNNAFANMTAVEEVLIGSSTVVSIGDSAFHGCTVLKTIELPATLKTIGTRAFRDCAALKSITIPAGVSAIADETFCNCAALESVVLPATLKTIGEWAFYRCTALKAIDFPAALTQIDEEAFYGCSDLESVTIASPAALTVRKNAFSGCDSLIKAVYEHVAPTTESGNEELVNALVPRYGKGGPDAGGISWEADRALGILTIKGSGAVTSRGTWESVLPYVNTVIFDAGITEIGANLLTKVKNITTVKIADTVKKIGDGAFEQCTGLTSVQLPGALTTLGKRAFYDCSSLKTIALPGTLSVISDDAFTSCTSLHTVEFGEGLLTIGFNAFKNCTALDTVAFPESLTTLSLGAFSGCSALRSITLTRGKLAPISAGTFNGCSQLSTVYFNGTSSEWNTLIANADSELKNATLRQSVKLTIYYNYEDGTTAAPAKTVTGVLGETVTVPSPTIQHYEPSYANAVVTLNTEGTQSFTVTYTKAKYVLTVKYQDVYGNLLAETATKTVVYGDTVTVPSPTVEGYTADRPSITIESMSASSVETVVYTANTYTVTVKYQDEAGNAIPGVEDEVISSQYKTSVTIPVKEIEHYEVIGTYDAIESLTQDTEVTVKYKKIPTTMTVYFVNEAGENVAQYQTITVYYGDPVKLETYPDVTGLAPAVEGNILDAYNGEASVNVVYKVRECKIILHFVEVDSNGYKMLKDETITVKYGEKVDYTVPAIEGYTTEREKIYMEKVVQDLTEIDIVYTRGYYKLTINYVDAQGAPVGDPYVVELQAGSVYKITVPAPNGYKIVGENVLEDTMGLTDQSFDIVVETENEDDPQQGGTEEPGENTGVVRTIVAIVLIIVVLVGGAVALYFLYMKKRF